MISYKTYTLDELCEFIRNGKSISQSKEISGLPITRIETIANSEINPNRVGYAGILENDIKDYLLKEGDILFSHINSLEHLFKTAIYKNNPDKLVHGMNLLCLRANQNKIFPNYLLLLLRSPLAKHKMMKFANKSVNQASISVGNLKTISFDIPPLSTQIHIAQILDKADNLINQRKLAIAKLDELLQATFVKMFGDPAINPMGWEVVKISQIADYFNGLTYKPEQVTCDGVIVLRSSNIQNSQLDFDDIVCVDTPIKEKLFVKENDILMCSRNGSAKLVGKVALIQNLKKPMTFGAFMMIIRSSEKYANYLMSYFQTPAFRRQIATSGTTTINQITVAMMNRIELPLPNNETLAKFAQIAKQIESQKATLQIQLKELETLFLALEQKAFGGGF